METENVLQDTDTLRAPGAIVRAAIPGADEAVVDFILWGRTSYPFGTVDAKRLYLAACRFDRAGKSGIQLCDWCDNKVEEGNSCCVSCQAGLNKAKE